MAQAVWGAYYHNLFTPSSHVRTFIWLAEAFGLSLTLVLLLTPVVIRSAAALKLFDAPDGGRRIHSHPVARLGGVAVFLGAAAVASVLFSHTQPRFTTAGPAGVAEIRFLAGAFIGSAFLFLVGLVDDIRGLSAGVKFIAEVIAASIAFYFGAHLGTIALGFGPGVSVGIFGYPLLVLWIVGVTNVFNFIDGLDGLAGGIAVVACAAIIVASLVLGNLIVLLPTVALAGALLGFLRYNFPKAKIFLGDSGSLSVGFLLAVFSIQASVNAHGAVLFIIPLLAIAVPLMDGTLAILRRWLRGVPISGADARHIHHRLLALGITARNTAIILWALGAALAGFGLLVALTAPFVATSLAILGFVAVAVMVIYGTNLLAYHELSVAGEVLISAPSRFRRVISDQIIATELTSQLRKAKSVEEISEILVESSAQFGFLGIALSGDRIQAGRHVETLHPATWAWKLDYPIRMTGTESLYGVLSIWCSHDNTARPYGAERIARIVGPAVEEWFNAHENNAQPTLPSRTSRRFSKRLTAKF